MRGISAIQPSNARPYAVRGVIALDLIAVDIKIFCNINQHRFSSGVNDGEQLPQRYAPDYNSSSALLPGI